MIDSTNKSNLATALSDKPFLPKLHFPLLIQDSLPLLNPRYTSPFLIPETLCSSFSRYTTPFLTQIKIPHFLPRIHFPLLTPGPVDQTHFPSYHTYLSFASDAKFISEMIPIIQNPPYIFPCRLLTMSLHKGEGLCLLLMKHSSQCSRTLDQLMTVRILTGLQIQQTVLTCRFQIPKVVECILWKNKFKTVVKQSSGGSKGRGPVGPGLPPIFRPNWGPKGWKIFLETSPPLLISQ